MQVAHRTQSVGSSRFSTRSLPACVRACLPVGCLYPFSQAIDGHSGIRSQCILDMLINERPYPGLLLLLIASQLLIVFLDWRRHLCPRLLSDN